MGREPRPRKSFRCLGEGENELPPVDIGYWATRMSKLSHLRDRISQYQDQAFVRQAKYYVRRHWDQVFKVGDLVKKPNQILSSAAGNVASNLAPKFTGHFVVVEVISPNVYNIASQEGQLAGRYHVSHLQRYLQDEDEEELVDPEREVSLDRELLEIEGWDTADDTDVVPGGAEVDGEPGDE